MVTDLIERGIRDGYHLGAALCVSLLGKVVLDVATGEARPGTPMTRDTGMIWKSSTKPIVAAVVMQCVERGELSLDDPVASHLPAFAAGGKQAITIKQLLTHTGGFRDEPFAYPSDSWQDIIDAICAMPLEAGWTPGQTAGYHPTTSWFILGELIQRVTGEYLPDFVLESVFEPLGIESCYLGMPGCAYDAAVEAGRLASLPNLSEGGNGEDAVHTRDWLTACSPGSSGVGPMRQLVRFYEMMLGGGEIEGERVLARETVDNMTHRHRAGRRDLTFAFDVDWGLGLLLNRSGLRGRMPYGYGKHASPDAFGHSGVQSSAAFADPEHGLAVAVGFVGMPGERVHQHRMHELLTVLYEELGLA